jgi:O-acetyl-ADP-ribose deacetylase (regulator of RNase III)
MKGYTMRYIVGRTDVHIVQGNVTEQDTDAIVNAANPTLMGGGGVDGAIHRMGGPRILEECKKIREANWPGGLPTGRAVITTGGDLKARYVIHTVGPVWHGGGRGESGLLAEAYWNSLQLAASKNLTSIAFPAISTGAYGYPANKASRIALRTVKSFLQAKKSLRMVVFVLFTPVYLEIYKKTAAEILS